MQFLKKFALPFLLVTAAAPFVYGGSSFMNGAVLKPWKFSLNACVVPIMVKDDPFTMPDIGFRVGLPGNTDFGLKIFDLGAIIDFKYIFMEFYPFKMALDIEATFASHVAAGAAVIMDLELNSYLAVYLSARWRYPSMIEIDPSFFTYSEYTPLGVMFLARFGFELFRHNVLSFGLEGGAVTSWTSSSVGFNAGGFLIWHIN